MKFYYTYVLSSKDGRLYVGYSENIRKRVAEHQRGLVRSTKSYRPWQLVYYEACLEKEDAIKREKQFKTGFGRAYLKRRIRI
ncbi:MAG: GIY-YIG nuclease family protein [Parcubacteria group bacterium]|nr:GIY-YIG nuclease family protein [Parcubacteria group bacterium]